MLTIEKIVLITLVVLLTNFSAGHLLASHWQPTNAFFPFTLNASDKGTPTMSEVEYHQRLDQFTSLYNGEFEHRQVEFSFIRRWSDGIINARSSQQGGEWSITVNGGLARTKHMTKDAFDAVICHEIGHHLGGAPHYLTQWSWASTEGQADYFSALKCLRKLYQNDDNVALIAKQEIDPLVKSRCNQVFSSPQKSAICQRAAAAGMVIARLQNWARRSRRSLAFDTPDAQEVSTTLEGYPSAQCRLDTYLAAATCPVAKEIELSPSDPTQGVCIADSHHFGFRPACWFFLSI
ncbi:MAG: hypothetical protein HN353_07225 [Bdellovibrionales bacterium]|jgi:hypothetical protein|nr:hypothetical protein [Bdellovibrionales bacterium]MBT3526601.1 hypothetical protein [Bdellovibrionales bacterium]MBT7668038.1 hypothetical protein [Bdellovibrionales bacterium]MBT7767781.1 hypothetical protein [Bdellovibrionales bacterium]